MASPSPKREPALDELTNKAAAPRVIAAPCGQNQQDDAEQPGNHPSCRGDITILVEVMGWLAAAAAVLVLTAPETLQRWVRSFWDAIPSNPFRRAIGVVNIAFGLGLGWVAFFVL